MTLKVNGDIMELSDTPESVNGKQDTEAAPISRNSHDPLLDHKLTAVDDMDKTNSDSSMDESGEGRENGCCRYVGLAQHALSTLCKTHKEKIKIVVLAVALLVYAAYFIAACILDFTRATPLLIINSLVIAWLLYRVLWMRLSSQWVKIRSKVSEALKPRMRILTWVSAVAIILLVIVITAVVIGRRFEQYRGLIGLAFFVITLFLTSVNPSKVRWRPVLWGMLLNFIFAIVILKTKAGLKVFTFLANQVTTFLSYTQAGSSFVFGRDTYQQHYFAFAILPTIVFFSCVISLLYYVGVMQAMIQRIAFVMQLTMGTSATESLSCAGNIFVGQTEAPILVRPFLPDMTRSELHAVMTGGFATIAGGVLAAFIGMGIDPVHLICASVMNAPMALALSKLSYPETEKPHYVQGAQIKFAKPTEQNFIEAAAAGASQSIGLVANIAANLIAFLSLLAFINAVLSWIGSMVDCPQLSFELICSYIFWIVPYVMGVESKDCFTLAELIGTKLVINEFVAYEKLGAIIENRETCTLPYISKKSEIIATYALCGFANLSSVGVQLGGIGAMAPSRRSDLANLVIRALLVGTVATLMTATLAGILITGYDDADMCNILTNGTIPLNTTSVLIASSNSTTLT